MVIFEGKVMQKIVSIRSYEVKPGQRRPFHELTMNEAVPLLRKHGFTVLDFGPSQHDQDSYYLIREFENLDEMRTKEEVFYGSLEWRQGSGKLLMEMVASFTTVVLYADEFLSHFQQNSRAAVCE